MAAVEGSSSMPHLSSPMSTRINPPLAARFELPRPQVCDHIFAAGGARVVLIAAPAGFGKTTVMRQVLERCKSGGLAHAWLTVDSGDNDPLRFLSGLAAALDSVMPGIAVERESGEAGSDGGRLAAAIFDRLAKHDEPFVLFLDDFEAIQSTTVMSLVRQAIQCLPKGAQIVVGSRAIPDLGLGRLRAGGWLMEIDASELRFTMEEAGSFLTAHRNLQLRHDEVATLHAKTEGWAAALWLASMAISERQGGQHPARSRAGELPADFIQRFSGSDASITDYLAEDVLGHQSPEVREFLLRTSILQTLSGPVCDAVCGGHDSHEVLERLERMNLFVLRLDDNREQYRYHGLFSGFLRAQLARSRSEEVPRLHRAASDWYRGQGRPIPAIDHALSSGDLGHALSMLASHAPALLAGARMGLLTRWLDNIPNAHLADHPMLQIIHAWAVNFTRGAREAMVLVDQFESTSHELGEEASDYLLTLKAVLLLRTDRFDEAHALSERNLDRLLSRPSFHGSLLATSLGTLELIRGNFVRARELWTRARRADVTIGGGFGAALAEAMEGSMELPRGHLRNVVSRMRGSAEPRTSGAWQPAKGNALASVVLAEALYELDECGEAEQLLNGCVPLVREAGSPDQIISGHVLMARVLFNRGLHDQAFQSIMELEHVGHRMELDRAVASARLERARLTLMIGNIEAAKDELDFAANDPLWNRVGAYFLVANDVEDFELARLRWMIHAGSPNEAAEALVPMLEAADRAQRMRRALKIRILLAEALYRAQQTRDALRHFGKAMVLAGAEGFIRSFVDEGRTIAKLAEEWSKSHVPEGEGIPRPYFDRLMAALGKLDKPAGVAGSELTEPLTRKELKVLHLLAEGLSNRALAEKLFLSETTVRSHLRNINVKLGVHSRMQAIVAARRLGIVT